MNTTDDRQLKLQKLEMWQKRKVALELEYKEAIDRKAAAAKDGDLSENNAYKDAIEAAELAIARKQDVEKIITDLKKDLGIDQRRGGR